MLLLLIIAVPIIWFIVVEVRAQERREAYLKQKIEDSKKLQENTQKVLQDAQKAIINIEKSNSEKEIRKNDILNDVQYNKALEAYGCLEIKKNQIKDTGGYNVIMERHLLSAVQSNIKLISNGIANGAEVPASTARIKYGNRWYLNWKKIYYDNIDDQQMIEVALAYELIYGDATISDLKI